MAEAECFKVLDYFKNEKELKAVIDEKKTFGEKKRVCVSLKN